MIWWQWLIVIAFYFICLWGSRFIVFLLVGLLVSKVKNNMKTALSEKMENLKGGLKNEL